MTHSPRTQSQHRLKNYPAVFVLLYAATFMCDNFGANTTTFVVRTGVRMDAQSHSIHAGSKTGSLPPQHPTPTTANLKPPPSHHQQIPAEIFPTEARATCHGISAAFGKAGAALGAAVFLRLVNSQCPDHFCTKDSPREDVDRGVKYVMSLFGFGSVCLVVKLRDSCVCGPVTDLSSRRLSHNTTGSSSTGASFW